MKKDAHNKDIVFRILLLYGVKQPNLALVYKIFFHAHLNLGPNIGSESKLSNKCFMLIAIRMQRIDGIFTIIRLMGL